MSSYNLIWLTFVMGLADVVLVVLLLLVMMTVSSGTINGLILYVNIVSFSGLLDNQNCVIRSCMPLLLQIYEHYGHEEHRNTSFSLALLLSCAKLWKSLSLLSTDNITDSLHPYKVWVYGGIIGYFSFKRLPLFIVAVLFLIILFMPYTLFLLCGQWLQYLPRQRGFRWIHSIFISTFICLSCSLHQTTSLLDRTRTSHSLLSFYHLWNKL